MKPKGVLVLAAVLWIGGIGKVDAEDLPGHKEVEKGIQVLSQLFVKGDKNGIMGLMTVDHIAITPYYGGPLTVLEELKNLSDHRLEEYGMGKAKLTSMAKGVVLVHYPLTLKGTYKENGFREVSCWGGLGPEGRKWLEAFYQESLVEGKKEPWVRVGSNGSLVNKSHHTLAGWLVGKARCRGLNATRWQSIGSSRVRSTESNRPGLFSRPAKS